MSVRDLGFLFLPADDAGAGLVVEAGPDWGFDPEVGSAADVLVWGRGPLPSGTPLSGAVRFAARRELTLRRIRRSPSASLGRFAFVNIHRLPPPRLYGGPLRNRMRAAFLEGAVVELRSRAAGQPLLDAVAAAAGVDGRGGGVRPTSAGGAMIRVGRPDTRLRVGRAGGPADPRRAADGLDQLRPSRLDPAGRGLLPEVLARGSVSGAAWTLETTVRGRRPPRLTKDVVADAVAFSASLPPAEGPPTAHRDDVRALSRALPDHAHDLERVAERIDEDAPALPGVFRHGDFWAGNLLVSRGRLSGVVDWDAWHRAAPAGVDVFHLLGTDRALRLGLELGVVWLDRPWRSEAFERALRPYWRSLRIDPSRSQTEAIALAWWVGQMAATLTRIPERAGDGAWLDANVDRVLRSLDS
jgi:hypothetical protein